MRCWCRDSATHAGAREGVMGFGDGAQRLACVGRAGCSDQTGTQGLHGTGTGTAVHHAGVKTQLHVQGKIQARGQL